MAATTMQQAAFFFGSGISIESGMPTVGKITNSLLEEAWKSHTNQRFYPCRLEDGQKSIGRAKSAQQFLRIIKEKIDGPLFFGDRRHSNYEDLYAAVRQITEHETGEYTNPLIADSVEVIRNASSHLWVEIDRAHIDRNRFASLADRAGDLIQWVVYHSLKNSADRIGLNIVSEVASLADRLDIFSLNHDLLLESQLAGSSIEFADGFSERKGNIVQFDWSWKDNKVCLLKLHGSINWYLFRFEGDQRIYDQAAKVLDDSEHSKDEHGNLLLPLDNPMFLTGTSVKESAYGTGLFGEIFAEFRKRLSRHRTLICSGYGWGDKGINVRLNQWIRDRAENRVVILHGGPIAELHQKRFWYWRWEDYLKANKVVVIPKWLSACTLEDLKPYFEVE